MPDNLRGGPSFAIMLGMFVMLAATNCPGSIVPATGWSISQMFDDDSEDMTVQIVSDGLIKK